MFDVVDAKSDPVQPSKVGDGPARSRWLQLEEKQM
jgi:hypothetical protein